MSTGYFPFQNLQKMYTPFLVCPFQLQLVFGIFFFFKKVCQNNLKIFYSSRTCHLCIVRVNTNYEKLVRKVCAFECLIFIESLTFVRLFSQCHGFSYFFLFRILNWHLMHLISKKKKLVLNTLSFLLQPLKYKYIYLHNSQWTKTWQIFLQKTIGN